MFNSSHIDGKKAFDEKSYEIAKGSFLQAIIKNPEVAESYFYLGQCYFYCDEKPRAISTLNKFIELRHNTSADNANVAHAFDLLGLCYEAKHKNEAALVSYRSATYIYPDCSSAWHNMGLLNMKFAMDSLNTDLEQSEKFFRNAHAFIKKALEICSNNPVFLQSIASWYEQYIEVLEKAEDEDAVQKNIANHFINAIQYYQEALSVCPEQAVCTEHDLALRNIISDNLIECLAQYGHHFFNNNDYKNAQKTYLEVLSLDPEHDIVIAQMKRTEEAISSLIEDEMTLNEAKLAATLISTPQTLFGKSSAYPQITENKIAEESSFQYR